MTGPKPTAPWLIVSIAGMELAWRFAWANTLTLLILASGYPPVSAVLAYFSAAGLTRWGSGRGWRVLTLVLLHILGFTLVSLHLIYHFHVADGSFWRFEWIADTMFRAQPATFWLIVVTEIILVAFFWQGGVKWRRKEFTYQEVSNRFDLGLSALILLFIFIFLLRIRFEVEVADPHRLLPVLTFICFGLPALTLARIRGQGVRRLMIGGGVIWTLVGFGAVGMLTVAGAVMFFMPQLTAAAESSIKIIAIGGRPFFSAFIALIRLMYGPRNLRPDAGLSETGDTSPMMSVTDANGPGWLERFFEAAAWSMFILLTLAAAFLISYLLYILMRRLLSRTSRDHETSRWIPGRRWMERFLSWVTGILKRADRNDPVVIYGKLQRWGRRSGQARFSGETPREYGRRLAGSFPIVENEIATIVNTLEYQVYSAHHPTPVQVRQARRFLSRLHRPDLWLIRLKAGRHILTG
jgi:hypothetical protein